MAIQKAERFRTDLIRRGVLLVPVIWGQGKAPQNEKKGFGIQSKAAAALPSIGVRSEALEALLRHLIHQVLVLSIMCTVTS